MAGFSSFSDMITEITTNGKSLYSTFMKVSSNGAVLAAGRWCEWYTATGTPGAGSQTGTAGAGTQLTGGGINIGNAVSTDIRSLLTLQGWSPTSTLVPAVAILCDFLVYWPSEVVTGTPTTLSAAALPRYTDGKGVMAMVTVQTALGAATPALTLTCTWDDDTSSVAGAAVTAPATSLPKSGFLEYTSTPFVPLASGKSGVKAITSYTIDSGSTTGTVCFFLVKPLATIPIVAINTVTERDMVVQMPSLPRVYDNACLAWITQVGGAMATSTSFGGFVGMGWG